MIFTDSNSELFSTNFSSNNTIGFDSKELMEMCSEELLNLRVSVINYLNCRKLKHRNAEFMKLFHRINHELRLRKIMVHPLKLKDKKPNEININNQFLGKKFTFSDSLFEIDFPSFLNDKDGFKQTKQAADLTTFENCLKQKKKNLATNQFNKGLFNEKFDFELSEEDLSFYHLNKPKKIDNEKEKILNDTMFSAIPEDMFFSLN